MKELKDNIDRMCRLVKAQHVKLERYKKDNANRANHAALDVLKKAVNAGKIAKKDKSTLSFWHKALLNDFVSAKAQIDAMQSSDVLSKVTASAGNKKPSLLNKLGDQNKALADARASLGASSDFSTVYAKAKADNPQLFS